jgi:HSP20 family protein
MNHFHKAKLRKVHGRMLDIARQLSHPHFPHIHRSHWRPSVNVFRCLNCIRVCVDLAGVDQALIEIDALPRRLLIRGRRSPPEPTGKEHKAVRVLALEIDCGPFEREIPFDTEVEPQHVKSEQRNGLLWILLPFRMHS